MLKPFVVDFNYKTLNGNSRLQYANNHFNCLVVYSIYVVTNFYKFYLAKEVKRSRTELKFLTTVINIFSWNWAFTTPFHFVFVKLPVLPGSLSVLFFKDF